MEDMTSLTLGAVGAGIVLEGRTFVETARGAWNEWTVRIDGRTAFLSEWAGVLTLYEEGSLAPPLEGLAAGAELGWIVVERGEARRVASWGAAAVGPAAYAYADLSSRTGARATIDYGADEPRVFVGRPVTAAELGLEPKRPRFFPSAEVARPADVELWLAPGDEGELDGVSYRVTGVVARRTSASIWNEYALHHPAAGLRWLVEADGHWSLATAIEAGLVAARADGAVHDGTAYALAFRADATVAYTAGELPWRIAIGDAATVEELSAADGTSLTFERTEDAIGWTRSRPLAPDAIARAFGKRALPRPR